MDTAPKDRAIVIFGLPSRYCEPRVIYDATWSDRAQKWVRECACGEYEDIPIVAPLLWSLPLEPPKFAKIGWRPIETAPKDGRAILAHYVEPSSHSIEWYGITRFEAGDWQDLPWSADGARPTHWKPLPDAPDPR
jgi:hypothetical protein